MFEKDKNQRSAINITISGLGGTTEPMVIQPGDITDV
jgi:hypothetical protein